MSEKLEKNETVEMEHIGLLVKNLDKTIENLNLLPESGPWTYYEYNFSQDKVLVGAPYKIKVALGEISGVPVEIIEPILEESKNSYMVNYLEKNGEGLHHIAYTFKNKQEFQNKVESLKNNDHEVILEAQIVVGEETNDAKLVKVYYLEPPSGGTVIEVNYSENVS